MWIEATKVAIMGFSVVFLTLAILAGSVKVMSLVCKRFQKKGGK
jgi:Na+-transporting methylmalonyl-CoA/oxaloacetate decarboxylase gamma subunit